MFPQTLPSLFFFNDTPPTDIDTLSLHDALPIYASTLNVGMRRSFIGAIVGAGTIYTILRMGKWLFGRQRVKLPVETKIIFTDTSVHLPDKEIPYEELF